MHKQTRHWLKQGKLFGYPDCCIEAFIALQHWNDGSPRKLHGTGFIPCVCCNITKSEEQMIQEINNNRCREFKPFTALEPREDTLYMVEAESTGDYSFITKELGYFTLKAGLKKAVAMTYMMQCYGSNTRFYTTPILGI